MSHAEALEKFGAYFAGALSREEVRAFHAHLNDCEDCKVRVRAARAAAPRAGFTRLGGREAEDKLEKVLAKNRSMTYIVLAVLAGFLVLFRLFFRRP
jgi:hypothetical protein